MATVQEKTQCVLWLAEFKSVISVQRRFRREYQKDPPHENNIRRWMKQFKDTGTVSKRKQTGRPGVSDDLVEEIRLSCVRSPKKSITRRSMQFGVAKSTMHKVLHKKLKLHGYKIQLLHEIKPTDRPRRTDFAVEILQRIDNDPNFLQNVLFTDEATFHVNGSVNRHNCRIWGAEHPRVLAEYIRDSPKVNVWCGLMYNRIFGPFFFAEKTINGAVYLDMLENFLFPQLEEIEDRIIFQQDGAPPHYHNSVTDALNMRFPLRWIGRGGPIPWPPRSPDITPLDFFCWGYVKNIVYSENIRDLEHLRQRIVDAFQTITPDMLDRVWKEVDYRLDVCRATNGAHIETYWH